MNDRKKQDPIFPVPPEIDPAWPDQRGPEVEFPPPHPTEVPQPE